MRFRFSPLVLGLLGFALVALACGDELDLSNPLSPGQTEFTNTEPGGSNGRHGGYNEGDYAGAADSQSGKASPTAPPGTPPQGRTDEVEEADIYKVSEDRLFYLNTYRGFIIYDFKNPKSPQLISRLGVYGYPIEMFIQGNTVYALIKDALYLSQENGKLQFKRHNVSQLVAIDITDLKNPKVLKTVDIIGELREGVSRKVGDTIYVVSYISQSYYWGWSYAKTQDQKEQAWVYSFNVKDPKNLVLVDKLKVFEGGSYNVSGGNVYESRYFNKVAISATSNTLMVVENWYVYGYVSGGPSGCGASKSLQEAIVSIIDISDPSGKIALYSKFETYGQLGDQFKQTYIFDKTTGKATYLGIFARQEWGSSGCSGSSTIKNTLESWDVTDGKKPTRLVSLDFGKPNETVRGSVFDPDRMVAFAITARNVDPLYAISFADPSKLKIVSMVDGLSGDMNVFRFVENKKFLVAIGRDTTKTCTGFNDTSSGFATQVAVSLIDVQDLNAIKLVERQCVAVKNASWISSQLNWDLDQAHKMIGMHSDGTVNVITVPVYYYKQNTIDTWSYYRYETAVGLMTWDLAKYNVKDPGPQKGILQNYGTIIHPNGQVERSVVFTHKAQNKRMVFNLSDTHIALVDIADLNNPISQSVVEVAPYMSQLFRFGDYIVEQVEQSPGTSYYGNPYGGATEFRVKKAGGSLDQATEVAQVVEAQVARAMKWKDSLLIFRQVQSPSSKTGYPYSYYYDIEVQIYDFKNPAKPVKRGKVTLPMHYLPYYYYWFGPCGFRGGYWFDDYYGYTYYNSSWTPTDDGLSFLTYEYDAKAQAYLRKLVWLNLKNQDTPTTAELTLTSNSDWAFFSLIPDQDDPTRLYLTYRILVGQVQSAGETLNLYKYFAQRWQLSGGTWVKGAAINLPGRLVKSWKQGKETIFLTYDFAYKKVQNGDYAYWQPIFRLNLLRENTLWGQSLAELLDYQSFGDRYLSDLVVDGTKLYVNATSGGYYYYNYKATGDWTKDSDQLSIFDMAGFKLKNTYAAPIGTYNTRLMGTYQGKLFMNLPGDGVLVVNTSNPQYPQGQQFLRTLGYATHIEFVQSMAYVASGYFGIFHLDLGQTATLPSL